MTESRFLVIIVSWNVKGDLARCLASLEREREAGADFGATVIDNGSHDGSAQLVRQQFPQVRLIALDKNIGFAAAGNLGAREAEGDYLLFLNPDVEIAAGFFSDLERAFIHHPKAGIIGGHIFNPDGTTQASVRGFPDLWVGLLEATKMLGRFSWLASRYLLPKFDYAVSQEVEQVMGACFAVRRQAWKQLNGFDEKFFVWFEEVDFCQRARQQGYEVWYETHLNLVHLGGQSFSQLSYTQRHRYFMRSLVHYLHKHAGGISAALVWLISRPALAIAYIYDYAVGKRVY